MGKCTKCLNVLVKPTNDCNLNCKYCFDRKMRQELHGKKLSDEMVKKLVNLTADHADAVSWIWHGGEPTIMPRDFYERSQEHLYSRYDATFEQTMQSNGINIIKDQSWVSFLEDMGITYGISYDILSQDVRSDIELNYEKFIKEQLERDAMDGAITVINKHNISKLIEMYEHAKVTLNNRFTLCYNLVFKTEDSDENGVELTFNDMLAYLPQFTEHILLDNTSNAMNERTTMEFLTMLVGGKDGLTCSRGDCRYNWLCMVANGDLYPCDRAIKQYNLGNIKDITSIEEVFQSEAYQKYVSDIDYRLETHCEKCSYYSYCNGGCNSRHAFTGEEPSSRNLNTQLCEEYKIQFNSIYKVLQNVEDYNDVNPLLRIVLTNNKALLPVHIGNFLSAELGRPISLDVDCTDIAELDLVASPQFKLFQLFNSAEYKRLGNLDIRYKKVLDDNLNHVKELIKEIEEERK